MMLGMRLPVLKHSSERDMTAITRGCALVMDMILVVVTWSCLSRRETLDNAIKRLTFAQVMMRDGTSKYDTCVVEDL